MEHRHGWMMSKITMSLDLETWDLFKVNSSL